MSTPTRIYIVTTKATGQRQLVRAANQAQALRCAAACQFDVAVAGQEDLVELVSKGEPITTAAQSEPTEAIGQEGDGA